MSTVSTPLITAAEFARMPDPPDGSKQELVRGEIVMTPPPGYEHGRVQGRVYFALESFVRANPIGSVAVESGLTTETDPDTIRGPDVSFWSFERLPRDQRPAGYPTVPADLVVEVLSPSTTRRAMIEKVREYLTAGVRMVWVVDPDDHMVTVYRQPGEGRVLWEGATLTGEDVLPGFSCRVGEFFA